MSNNSICDHRPDLNRFRHRLRRFSRVRRHLVNRALGYRLGAIALSALAVLLVTPSDRFDLPLLDAALLVICAVLAVVLTGIYLSRRHRYAGDLGEAFRMEALGGDLNSRLVSAYDFLERGLDAPLPDAVITRALQDLERTDYEARLARRPRALARRRFVLLLTLVALLLGCEFFGYRRLAGRVGLAWSATHQLFFPTEWTIVPGPGRHVRLLGDEIEVALRFQRHGFDTVTLVQHDHDDPAAQPRRTELETGPDQVARVVLRGDVESGMRLHFEFGRHTTADTPIDVIFTSRPMLENMQIELIAPAYTRQPPRDLDGLQSRIAGLPGTRVSIGLTFSKPLETVTLAFDDGETVAMDEHGRFAGTSFVIGQARRARIQIEDIHGFGLLSPHVLDIELLADEPPRLAVPGFLKTDMPARPEDLRSFGFGVRTWDDYGVARTVLRWRRSTLDNRHAVTGQGEAERPVAPPLPNVIAEFQNVFEDLDTQPGDLISFHLEVEDNRAPSPQVSVSPTFSFFIHADDLDGMRAAGDLMFGRLGALGGPRGRIARARRETSIPPPQDIRTLSQLRSDYTADVATETRPPTVRGDFAAQVEQYFRVLSSAVQRDEDE